MPKKPALQPRPTLIPAAAVSKPSAPRSAMPTASHSKSTRVFYQCLACGALADPMYGVWLGSWCPSCNGPDAIDRAVGRLPEPQRYGEWCRREQEAAAAQSASVAPAADPTPGEPTPEEPVSSLFDFSSLLNPTDKACPMKTRKTHTGLYCCPECCEEFDLVADESLKCDDCGGLLYKGSLEDFEEDFESESD